MRYITLLAILASSATANSWFAASDPEPTPWTQQQLEKAQATFQNIKEDSIATWNESRLRQFLLDNGVIEPKGTREQLEVAVRQYYSQYQSAVSTLSASASTAVYGDKQYQASKSASSISSQASKTASSSSVAASKSAASAFNSASSTIASAYASATDSVVRNAEYSKDYVYDTWDDNQMRTWLEQNGYIRTKSQVKRDDLIDKMNQYYTAATVPVYEAWSDSYLHEWLAAHNIIAPEPTPREKLLAQMKTYYYDSRETLWSSWSDSDMKKYLVKNNIVKSDAELTRDKYERLIRDNWHNTSDAFWASWKESEMKDWLIEHGYLRTDAQAKKDEITSLFKTKYNDTAARTQSWTTWKDARLRAYLRMHGVSEEALPGDRPSLLHEVRIRYVIAQNRVESFLGAIRNAITGSVEATEDKLGQILELISGAKSSAVDSAKTNAHAAQASTSSLKAEATKSAKDARAKVEL